MLGVVRRLALVALIALTLSPARAVAAQITLPDLKVLVPRGLISIGTDPNTGHRVLRFTHITADVGRGPFEVDPHFNARTGTSTFAQAIYASPWPGTWRLDHHVAIRDTGVWRPPSDYAFPLTHFTLNRVAAGGAPGAVLATSPKRDYTTGTTRSGERWSPAGYGWISGSTRAPETPPGTSTRTRPRGQRGRASR